MFSKVMLLVISAFVIGVVVAGFVFSQGASLSNVQPSSGVWHSADQLWCDNCISSINLADGSVGASELVSGSISDVKISSNAGIFTRKLNGANGWFFVIDFPASYFSGNWYPVPATAVNVMGMSDWTNSMIEITCEPRVGLITLAGQTWEDNFITTFAGSTWHTSGWVYRHNSRVLKLDSNPKTIYIARTDPSIHQNLDVRLGSGNLIEFRRTNPVPDSREPLGSQFECILKVLSTCNNGQLACNVGV